MTVKEAIQTVQKSYAVRAVLIINPLTKQIIFYDSVNKVPPRLYSKNVESGSFSKETGKLLLKVIAK